MSRNKWNRKGIIMARTKRSGNKKETITKFPKSKINGEVNFRKNKNKRISLMKKSIL